MGGKTEGQLEGGAYGSAVGALPAVCILAGGLGSRLGERVRDIPKPLLEVAGEPFLVHQLRLLAHNGITDVVLCVGYRGELIEKRIGAELFGMRISYSYDSPKLDGTLGAIRRALPLLGERFLVLYGDTLLRIDYRAVVASWRQSGCPAIMTVLRNEGRWDTSNAVYGDGLVGRYDKRHPTPEMSWIDYGLGGLTADVVKDTEASTGDLAELYGELATKGELAGFEATKRFYEIGTPQGLIETDEFVRTILRDRQSLAAAGRSTVRHLRSAESGLLGQGARYAVAGGTVALVYLGVTTVLAALVGMPFQAALAIGFCVSMVVHFTLQRAFVWTHHEEFALPLHHQAGRYLAAAGTQYGLTAASTSQLPPLLGVSAEVVYLVTVPVVVGANFLVFRHGIFHPRPTAPDSP